MFSGVNDSTVLHATSPEVVFSCQSKMAAAKPEILLAQRRKKIATKFQRLYPSFWGCDSNVRHATSPEVVFSCKSKMAAAKPEIILCQRKDALETKFQVLYPCFRGCPTQRCYMQHHRKLFCLTFYILFEHDIYRCCVTWFITNELRGWNRML